MVVVAIGSVYAALDRLQERGMVSSRVGDPTPQRGGRAKRDFTAEPSGVEALGAPPGRRREGAQVDPLTSMRTD